MKKISQVFFFFIIAYIMTTIWLVFFKDNCPFVYWATTESLYIIGIIRILIPSREERLRKMHKKNWKVKQI
jgi:hypothetical protein